VPEAIDAQQIPGQGVQATINGRRVRVGRTEMFDPARLNGDATALTSPVAQLARQGKTIVVVGIDDRPVGIIALADRPRANAAETLRRLRALGIVRTIMLTGDNAEVAANIAREVGADEVHAQLLPENKLELVRSLQLKHGPLAMVGDGVNDAPALATASVGIAMGGAASTDVALETADVALMADDLAKLPDAIALSRFSRRIIKQNLTIALGVIAILAPLSALGLCVPGRGGAVPRGIDGGRGAELAAIADVQAEEMRIADGRFVHAAHWGFGNHLLSSTSILSALLVSFVPPSPSIVSRA
jgi:Cd2+/Zn2+-exporting ATPase